ncbi:MAG: metallophosphoesterase [Chloroflexota bacterium]|jgi:uncharacterized protein
MARAMKILAVSDQVLDTIYQPKVKDAYPDIDLIIGCGDLPFYYLEFLISALDVPLVYVRGNHDRGPQYTVEGRVLTEVHGGVDLHGRAVKVEQLLLAGLEGSMRYRPGAPLMYSEAEMRWHVGQLLPKLYWNKVKYGRYLDILVTHSPPFGIHDRPDLAHIGFKIFLNFLRLFKPRYLLHGHIHIYRQDAIRQTRYYDTNILNVFPARVIEFS